MSDIRPQATDWLWADRIPIGELTLVDGDAGSNKTSIALDLAARLSTGREMPDGTPGRKGRTLLLISEDSLSKTIHPRLKDADADMSQIAASTESLTMSKDLSRLERMIRDLGACLVVIDPLATFPGCSAVNDHLIRQTLTPLRKVAERTGTAVVMLRHLSQSGTGNLLYRGLGSIAIVSLARSALFVARAPHDPDLWVACHCKCNLGPRTPNLQFEPVSEPGGAVTLRWHGECEYTAEDLMKPVKGNGGQLDAAKAFLAEVLAAGPVAQSVVQAQATTLGLALRTVKRAKAAMGVKSLRKGFGLGSSASWARSALA